MVDQNIIEAFRAARERLDSMPVPKERYIYITREQFVALGGDPAIWDSIEYEDEEDGNSLP